MDNFFDNCERLVLCDIYNVVVRYLCNIFVLCKVEENIKWFICDVGYCLCVFFSLFFRWLCII